MARYKSSVQDSTKERCTENVARLHVIKTIGVSAVISILTLLAIGDAGGDHGLTLKAIAGQSLERYFSKAPFTVMSFPGFDFVKNSPLLHAEDLRLFRQNGMAGYLSQNTAHIIGYSIFCIGMPRPAIDTANAEGHMIFKRIISELIC